MIRTIAPILVVMLLFVGNAAFGTLIPKSTSATIVGMRLGSWWIVAIAVVLIVLRFEQQPLTSLGWHPPSLSTFGWGVGLFVAAFLTAGVVARLVMPAMGLAQDAGQAARVAAMPLATQLAVFFTAAVVEELVCRGYVISRLLPFSPALAVIASAALFTLPHAFGWRPAQLVFVAIIGFVFSLFFLWRRDLPACILAHFLLDTAGFVMMRLSR